MPLSMASAMSWGGTGARAMPSCWARIAIRVPLGGWLDGAMGVIFALGAARAWRLARPDASVGIDVVALLPTRRAPTNPASAAAPCAACGPGLDDQPNAPLAAAMGLAGLTGHVGHRVDPARHRGYLEAHIRAGAGAGGGAYRHRRGAGHRRRAPRARALHRPRPTMPGRRRCARVATPAGDVQVLRDAGRIVPQAGAGRRGVEHGRRLGLAGRRQRGAPAAQRSWSNSATSGARASTP